MVELREFNPNARSPPTQDCPFVDREAGKDVPKAEDASTDGSSGARKPDSCALEDGIANHEDEVSAVHAHAIGDFAGRSVNEAEHESADDASGTDESGSEGSCSESDYESTDSASGADESASCASEDNSEMVLHVAKVPVVAGKSRESQRESAGDASGKDKSGPECATDVADQPTQNPPDNGPPSHRAIHPQATFSPAIAAPAPKPSTHTYSTAPASAEPQLVADAAEAAVHGLPDSRLQAMVSGASAEDTTGSIQGACDEGKLAEPGLRGLADASDAAGSHLPCEEAVHGVRQLQDATVTGNNISSPNRNPIATESDSQPIDTASWFRGPPATHDPSPDRGAYQAQAKLSLASRTATKPSTQANNHAPASAARFAARILQPHLPASDPAVPSNHGALHLGPSALQPRSAAAPAAMAPRNHPSQGMADAAEAAVHGLPDSRLQAMVSGASAEDTTGSIQGACGEGKLAEPGLRGLADASDAAGSHLPCEEGFHSAWHLQNSTVTGYEAAKRKAEAEKKASEARPDETTCSCPNACLQCRFSMNSLSTCPVMTRTAPLTKSNVLKAEPGN